MADNYYNQDKHVASTSVHRPAAFDSDDGSFNNRRSPLDPRGWGKRVWIGLGLVVVIILAVVPAVVVTEQKKNRYPDYSPLTYSLSETYAGEQFFDKFNYFTGYDPTGGMVHYVPKEQAQQLNLTYSSASRSILRVDTSVGPGSTPDASTGRFSVRVTSKSTYDKGLFLFDVRHAPIGCATWPALWLSDHDNWPTNGEIDVMESMNPPAPGQVSKADTSSDGTHDGNSNMMTLHTTDGCEMSVKRQMEGNSLQSDCLNSTNGNAGCGVAVPQQIGGGNGYGSGFNTGGGGVIALEIRDAGIRLWQFARGSSMPSDISSFAANVGTNNGRVVPNPSTWGTATADFPSTECTIGNHFRNQSIIINVTVCGDAIYPKWESSGCPMDTCQKFQAENPSAFTDAYWEFGGFEVYKAA